jgi:hypothetical protein
MRTLWPVTDRIQAEYESLRALALADAELGGPSALRFAQQGLVGLISWRRIELPFSVSLVDAQRPPWTPYADPRLDALMPGFDGIKYGFICASSRTSSGRMTDAPTCCASGRT